EVVVGHHPLDLVDAVGREVVRRPGQELGAGGGLLVRQDLAVGQTAVVIDHRVDVVVADPFSLVLVRTGGLPAMRAPAAPVGDLADLLDVHVHQLAGSVALVTHRRGLARADHLAGDRVQLAQVGHPMAAQDAGDGAGRDADVRADPVLSPASLAATVQDLLLGGGRGASGLMVRPGGPVGQPGLAVLVVAADPAVGAPT